MKNQKILLQEINRIKQMMDLPLILEGGGLGGALDSVWSKLTKETSNFTDEEIKILDDLIDTTPGLKSFDNAFSAINNRAAFLDALRASADDVAESLKVIAKSYSDNLMGDLTTRISAYNARLSTDVETALNELATVGFDNLTNSQLLSIKNRVNKFVKDMGTSIDLNAKKLADDTLDAIDATIYTRKNKTGQNILDDLTETLQTPNRINIDDIISDTNRTTQTLETLRRKYGQKFTSYEIVVDSIPTSDKVKNIMKISYETYGNYETYGGPAYLIQQGKILAKQLNDGKYGWLKKLFLSTDAEGTIQPFKTGLKTSGWVLGVVLVYVAVSFSELVGDTWVAIKKWWYENALRQPYSDEETDGSETPIFTISMCQAWFDSNNYVAKATDVSEISKNYYKCSWSGAGSSGNADFYYKNGQWVGQE